MVLVYLEQYFSTFILSLPSEEAFLDTVPLINPSHEILISQICCISAQILQYFDGNLGIVLSRFSPDSELVFTPTGAGLPMLRIC